MTTKQIRMANPQGEMTMVSGNDDIVFDNGVIFKSDNSRDKQKLWNKLLRMGYHRCYNFSSDEFEGIVQASKNGENPFEFKIISL